MIASQVAGTVTAAVVESHRVADRRGARGATLARVALRADHVVLEGEDAALGLQLFETLGPERFACELTLISAGEQQPWRLDGAVEHTTLERAARRRGAVFSRAGNGPAHQVYAARFGAPGRLVLGSDRRLARAGALGALALPAAPVEIAAVLAGALLDRPWPAAILVRLYGKPPVWVCGDDVALAVKRRLSPADARDRVLEFRVFEPEALAFDAREALAGRAPELGAVSALFPSDEITRQFLRVQGREADWKSLPGDPLAGEGASLDLDFSDLEPLVARAGEVVRLKELMEAPVRSVWVGPEASLSDLLRLVHALGSSGVHEGTDCVVTPANRQLHETAAQRGVIAALARARARVRFGAGDVRPRPDGVALACGVPLAESRRGWQLAGVETCAAAAAAGQVRDPRAQGPAPGEPKGEAYVVNDRLIARAAPEGVEAEDSGPSLRLAPPIRGPLRGVVLLVLGDHARASRVLPWGARVRPFALQIDTLASFAFAGADPGFAARARAEGGGLVVAGRDFGAGERREQTALVLVALGVRVIAARSFDPEFRRQLRQHGILALRFASDADAEGLRLGDEVEIPDLPEGLEPGKPLVLRDLTRGTPYALHHDLDAEGVDEVRAGGLLASWRLRAANGRKEP